MVRTSVRGPFLFGLALSVVAAYVLSAPDERLDLAERLPDNLAVIVEGADGTPERVFGDGVVTAAELERAAFATVECMEAAGYDVVDYVYAERQVTFTYVHGASPEEAAAAKEVELQCFEENFNAVSPIYRFLASDAVQTEDERQEEAAALLVECMRDAGVAVADAAEARALGLTDPETYLGCLDEVDDATR